LRTLKPNVPLPPGDPTYVDRPDGVSSRIARMTSVGRSPILVYGCAGVGKSTELAHATHLLRQQGHRTILVQLDKDIQARRLTPDHVYASILQELRPNTQDPASLDQVNTVLGEDLNLGPVTLILDGLDKLPNDVNKTRDIFEALAAIRDDVNLVVAVPWHVIFIPWSESVIRYGEHAVQVCTVDTRDAVGFMGEVLRRRVNGDLPEDILSAAALWSCGITRNFLRIVSDAATHACIRGHEGPPEDEDLNAAVNDLGHQITRSLLPGDLQAIKDAVGTRGTEMPVERKVRLMAQGILVERVREDGITLKVNHLVIS
jgi:hypothetical protein